MPGTVELAFNPARCGCAAIPRIPPGGLINNGVIPPAPPPINDCSPDLEPLAADTPPPVLFAVPTGSAEAGSGSGPSDFAGTVYPADLTVRNPSLTFTTVGSVWLRDVNGQPLDSSKHYQARDSGQCLTIGSQRLPLWETVQVGSGGVSVAGVVKIHILDDYTVDPATGIYYWLGCIERFQQAADPVAGTPAGDYDPHGPGSDPPGPSYDYVWLVHYYQPNLAGVRFSPLPAVGDMVTAVNMNQTATVAYGGSFPDVPDTLAVYQSTEHPECAPIRLYSTVSNVDNDSVYITDTRTTPGIIYFLGTILTFDQSSGTSDMQDTAPQRLALVWLVPYYQPFMTPSTTAPLPNPGEAYDAIDMGTTATLPIDFHGIFGSDADAQGLAGITLEVYLTTQYPAGTLLDCEGSPPDDKLVIGP